MVNHTSASLLGSLREVPPSVMELLKLSRGELEFFAAIQQRLLKGLRQHPDLSERVQPSQSIPVIGEIMALTWVLEVGEVERLPSIAQAASYCGLTIRLARNNVDRSLNSATNT